MCKSLQCQLPITQLFYLFQAFNSAGQMVDLPQSSFGVDSLSIFNAFTIISPFEAELFSTVEASIPPGGDFTNFLGNVLVPAGGSVGIEGSPTPIPEPPSVVLLLGGTSVCLLAYALGHYERLQGLVRMWRNAVTGLRSRTFGFWPSDEHWAVFRQMIVEGQAQGALISDAHLATLAP